ncbi:MAG: ABC transporter substrate-binding protein [Elusimicrobiota bacterium]
MNFIIILLSLILISGCGKEKEHKIEIRFWHGIESPENNQLLQKKVSEFEKRNPDIEIKMQNIGAQDKAMPKILTAISSDKEPELLWYAPVYTGRIAQSGKLVPAEEYFEQDPNFNPDNIYEGLLDSGRYKGKIYTVPFETNCLGIYYNKEHFQQAGIDKIPTSWQEFINVSKKLTIDKDKDGEPERYGFLLPLGIEEWTVWCWETFLWQAGGGILNQDKTAPEFHKTPGVQALKYWVDLKYKHKCAVLSSRNAGYKLDPFLSENVSMMINGPWNYPVLKQQESIKYGSFPLPGNKQKATNIGGENLYIFKSNAQKEEASWRFASFIMSEDFQVDWAIQTGYLPVNKRAAQSKKYQEFLNNNPFIRTFVQSMDFGRSRPPVKEYSRISDRIGKAIEKALYQKKTAEKALKEAAEQVKDLL